MGKSKKIHEDESMEDVSVETAEDSGDNRSGSDRRKADRRQAAEEGPAVSQEELSALKEELAKARSEVDSLKDLLQRRQADFENYKKRMMRQMEDSRKFTLRDIASDVITVNDDILRALDASTTVSAAGLDEANASIVEGIRMISGRMEQVLSKYGIEEIEALNTEFDPNFHEAYEIEMSPDVEADTVVFVHQKGYKLDDLVIRSSKVKVAKPGKGTAVDAPGDGAAEEQPEGGVSGSES